MHGCTPSWIILLFHLTFLIPSSSQFSIFYWSSFVYHWNRHVLVVESLTKITISAPTLYIHTIVIYPSMSSSMNLSIHSTIHLFINPLSASRPLSIRPSIHDLILNCRIKWNVCIYIPLSMVSIYFNYFKKTNKKTPTPLYIYNIYILLL